MANSRICSIPDCDKASQARGWCSLHYQRWKRNGSPDSVILTPKGAPQAFLDDVVMSFEGTECLIWPFATTKGYASHYSNGSRQLVSRILCEKKFGPPPSDRHEAAHSCGKGNSGCVSMVHLRWASPVENSHDKLAHGTRLMAEAHPNAKLSDDDVRQIRKLAKSTSQKSIASRYGVSKVTISQIVNQKSWKSIG